MSYGPLFDQHTIVRVRYGTVDVTEKVRNAISTQGAPSSEQAKVGATEFLTFFGIASNAAGPDLDLDLSDGSRRKFTAGNVAAFPISISVASGAEPAIVRATYGIEPSQAVDITTVILAKIADKETQIVAASANISSLSGVGVDPAPGRTKSLYLYLSDGSVFAQQEGTGIKLGPPASFHSPLVRAICGSLTPAIQTADVTAAIYAKVARGETEITANAGNLTGLLSSDQAKDLAGVASKKLWLYFADGSSSEYADGSAVPLPLLPANAGCPTNFPTADVQTSDNDWVRSPAPVDGSSRRDTITIHVANTCIQTDVVVSDNRVRSGSADFAATLTVGNAPVRADVLGFGIVYVNAVRRCNTKTGAVVHDVTAMCGKLRITVRTVDRSVVLFFRDSVFSQRGIVTTGDNRPQFGLMAGIPIGWTLCRGTKFRLINNRTGRVLTNAGVSSSGAGTATEHAITLALGRSDADMITPSIVSSSMATPLPDSGTWNSALAAATSDLSTWTTPVTDRKSRVVLTFDGKVTLAANSQPVHGDTDILIPKGSAGGRVKGVPKPEQFLSEFCWTIERSLPGRVSLSNQGSASTICHGDVVVLRNTQFGSVLRAWDTNNGTRPADKDVKLLGADAGNDTAEWIVECDNTPPPGIGFIPVSSYYRNETVPNSAVRRPGFLSSVPSANAAVAIVARFPFLISTANNSKTVINDFGSDSILAQLNVGQSWNTAYSAGLEPHQFKKGTWLRLQNTDNSSWVSAFGAGTYPIETGRSTRSLWRVVDIKVGQGDTSRPDGEAARDGDTIIFDSGEGTEQLPLIAHYTKMGYDGKYPAKWQDITSPGEVIDACSSDVNGIFSGWVELESALSPAEFLAKCDSAASAAESAVTSGYTAFVEPGSGRSRRWYMELVAPDACELLLVEKEVVVSPGSAGNDVFLIARIYNGALKVSIWSSGFGSKLADWIDLSSVFPPGSDMNTNCCGVFDANSNKLTIAAQSSAGVLTIAQFPVNGNSIVVETSTKTSITLLAPSTPRQRALFVERPTARVVTTNEVNNTRTSLFIAGPTSADARVALVEVYLESDGSLVAQQDSTIVLPQLGDLAHTATKDFFVTLSDTTGLRVGRDDTSDPDASNSVFRITPMHPQGGASDRLYSGQAILLEYCGSKKRAGFVTRGEAVYGEQHDEHPDGGGERDRGRFRFWIYKWQDSKPVLGPIHEGDMFALVPRCAKQLSQAATQAQRDAYTTELTTALHEIDKLPNHQVRYTGDAWWSLSNSESVSAAESLRLSFVDRIVSSAGGGSFIPSDPVWKTLEKYCNTKVLTGRDRSEARTFAFYNNDSEPKVPMLKVPIMSTAAMRKPDPTLWLPSTARVNNSRVAACLLSHVRTRVSVGLIDNATPAKGSRSHGVTILFRANGAPPNIAFADAVTDFQPAAYQQSMMSSGAVCNVEYRSAFTTDVSASNNSVSTTAPSEPDAFLERKLFSQLSATDTIVGEFSLARRGVPGVEVAMLRDLEYPAPPTNYIWAMPPRPKLPGILQLSTFGKISEWTSTTATPIATHREISNFILSDGVSFDPSLIDVMGAERRWLTDLVMVPLTRRITEHVGDIVAEALRVQLKEQVPNHVVNFDFQTDGGDPVRVVQALQAYRQGAATASKGTPNQQAWWKFADLAYVAAGGVPSADSVGAMKKLDEFMKSSDAGPTAVREDRQAKAKTASDSALKVSSLDVETNIVAALLKTSPPEQLVNTLEQIFESNDFVDELFLCEEDAEAIVSQALLIINLLTTPEQAEAVAYGLKLRIAMRNALYEPQTILSRLSTDRMNALLGKIVDGLLDTVTNSDSTQEIAGAMDQLAYLEFMLGTASAAAVAGQIFDTKTQEALHDEPATNASNRAIILQSAQGSGSRIKKYLPASMDKLDRIWSGLDMTKFDVFSASMATAGITRAPAVPSSITLTRNFTVSLAVNAVVAAVDLPALERTLPPGMMPQVDVPLLPREQVVLGYFDSADSFFTFVDVAGKIALLAVKRMPSSQRGLSFLGNIKIVDAFAQNVLTEEVAARLGTGGQAIAVVGGGLTIAAAFREGVGTGEKVLAIGRMMLGIGSLILIGLSGASIGGLLTTRVLAVLDVFGFADFFGFGDFLFGITDQEPWEERRQRLMEEYNDNYQRFNTARKKYEEYLAMKKAFEQFNQRVEQQRRDAEMSARFLMQTEMHSSMTNGTTLRALQSELLQAPAVSHGLALGEHDRVAHLEFASLNSDNTTNSALMPKRDLRGSAANSTVYLRPAIYRFGQSNGLVVFVTASDGNIYYRREYSADSSWGGRDEATQWTIVGANPGKGFVSAPVVVADGGALYVIAASSVAIWYFTLNLDESFDWSASNEGWVPLSLPDGVVPATDPLAFRASEPGAEFVGIGFSTSDNRTYANFAVDLSTLSYFETLAWPEISSDTAISAAVSWTRLNPNVYGQDDAGTIDHVVAFGGGGSLRASMSTASMVPAPFYDVAFTSNVNVFGPVACGSLLGSSPTLTTSRRLRLRELTPSSAANMRCEIESRNYILGDDFGFAQTAFGERLAPYGPQFGDIIELAPSNNADMRVVVSGTTCIIAEGSSTAYGAKRFYVDRYGLDSGFTLRPLSSPELVMVPANSDGTTANLANASTSAEVLASSVLRFLPGPTGKTITMQFIGKSQPIVIQPSDATFTVIFVPRPPDFSPPQIGRFAQAGSTSAPEDGSVVEIGCYKSGLANTVLTLNDTQDGFAFKPSANGSLRQRFLVTRNDRNQYMFSCLTQSLSVISAPLPGSPTPVLNTPLVNNNAGVTSETQRFLFTLKQEDHFSLSRTETGVGGTGSIKTSLMVDTGNGANRLVVVPHDSSVGDESVFQFVDLLQLNYKSMPTSNSRFVIGSKALGGVSQPQPGVLTGNVLTLNSDGSNTFSFLPITYEEDRNGKRPAPNQTFILSSIQGSPGEYSVSCGANCLTASVLAPLAVNRNIGETTASQECQHFSFVQSATARDVFTLRAHNAVVDAPLVVDRANRLAAIASSESAVGSSGLFSLSDASTGAALSATPVDGSVIRITKAVGSMACLTLDVSSNTFGFGPISTNSPETQQFTLSGNSGDGFTLGCKASLNRFVTVRVEATPALNNVATGVGSEWFTLSQTGSGWFTAFAQNVAGAPPVTCLIAADNGDLVAAANTSPGSAGQFRLSVVARPEARTNGWTIPAALPAAILSVARGSGDPGAVAAAAASRQFLEGDYVSFRPQHITAPANMTRLALDGSNAASIVIKGIPAAGATPSQKWMVHRRDPQHNGYAFSLVSAGTVQFLTVVDGNSLSLRAQDELSEDQLFYLVPHAVVPGLFYLQPHRKPAVYVNVPNAGDAGTPVRCDSLDVTSENVNKSKMNFAWKIQLEGCVSAVRDKSEKRFNVPLTGDVVELQCCNAEGGLFSLSFIKDTRLGTTPNQQLGCVEISEPSSVSAPPPTNRLFYFRALEGAELLAPWSGGDEVPTSLQQSTFFSLHPVDEPKLAVCWNKTELGNWASRVGAAAPDNNDRFWLEPTTFDFPAGTDSSRCCFFIRAGDTSMTAPLLLSTADAQPGRKITVVQQNGFTVKDGKTSPAPNNLWLLRTVFTSSSSSILNSPGEKILFDSCIALQHAYTLNRFLYPTKRKITPNGRRLIAKVINDPHPEKAYRIQSSSILPVQHENSIADLSQITCTNGQLRHWILKQPGGTPTPGGAVQHGDVVQLWRRRIGDNVPFVLACNAGYDTSSTPPKIGAELSSEPIVQGMTGDLGTRSFIALLRDDSSAFGLALCSTDMTRFAGARLVIDEDFRECWGNFTIKGNQAFASPPAVHSGYSRDTFDIAFFDSSQRLVIATITVGAKTPIACQVVPGIGKMAQ